MSAGEGQIVERHDALRAARFSGRFDGKLDSKGRIVVPADFRQLLAAPQIHVFQSLTEPVIQCGPASLMDDLLEAVAGQDVYDEDRWALEDEITGGVQPLPIDDTGRTSLPKDFREFAKLEGPIAFAGRGWHFILAPKAYLDDRRARAREAADRNRDTLRARMLPSVQAGRKP